MTLTGEGGAVMVAPYFSRGIPWLFRPVHAACTAVRGSGRVVMDPTISHRDPKSISSSRTLLQSRQN